MGGEAHRRILVVNDDQLLADSVCGLLAETGYDVTTAADGREGLDIVERWRPDLVVLDLIMPGMDGWSFLERMASHPPTERPRVLVWSAADSEYLTRALGRGASACLACPAMPEELLETIARVLAPEASSP
jgi:CheY-like chemotaxis protein